MFDEDELKHSQPSRKFKMESGAGKVNLLSFLSHPTVVIKQTRRLPQLAIPKPKRDVVNVPAIPRRFLNPGDSVTFKAIVLKVIRPPSPVSAPVRIPCNIYCTTDLYSVKIQEQGEDEIELALMRRFRTLDISAPKSSEQAVLFGQSLDEENCMLRIEAPGSLLDRLDLVNVRIQRFIL